MPEEIFLLQLSDIHFQKPQCLNPDMDAEKPLRTAIITDAIKMVEKLGKVEAILVSGDISYQADPEEFDCASQWLNEFAEKINCSPSKVFTVPGNHDVDRNIVREDQLVKGLRTSIKSVENKKYAEKFLQLFQCKESGPILMRPLEAYNTFAVKYDCSIYPPRPFWIYDIPLNKGMTLRMRGLSTPLHSGENGEKGKLFLGSFQTVFDPVENIVHLTIQHHPPDWLSDCDEVDNALWNGAKIHLMGHKHRQRILHTNQAVRLAAGAVNPDPSEPGWEPGYNIFEIKIIDENDKRWLEVKSHIRVWQTSPDKFVPKLDEHDSEVFCHRIYLCPISTQDKKGIEKDILNQETIKSIEEVASMSTEQNKDIVFRFWSLAASKRRKIVNELELLSELDFELPEFERYRKAFEKAKERNLLKTLSSAIENAERNE
jgi:predicted phosphodiesterase